MRPRALARAFGEKYIDYKCYIYRGFVFEVGIALSPTCVAHVDWNGGPHIALSVPIPRLNQSHLSRCANKTNTVTKLTGQGRGERPDRRHVLESGAINFVNNSVVQVVPVCIRYVPTVIRCSAYSTVMCARAPPHTQTLICYGLSCV
jgi:hypothetical protein